MAIIKCKECGKEISDQAERCIHCGYVNKIEEEKKIKKKDNKNNKNNKLFILGGIVVLIAIIAIVIIINPFTKKGNTPIVPNNDTICKNLTNIIQPLVNNNDTDGFEKAWTERESFNTDGLSCKELSCLCPSAWDLYLKNIQNKADNYLKKGLISSAYDELNYYISKAESIKEYHDQHNIFKILSSQEKEKITGIYHSFGEWKWEYKVGGSFKFNKRYVSFGSSSMSLQFDDYDDKVLISGHLKPSKHKNWNAEKNISVEWYNYKILDNKIYIKLTTEDDSKYDALFEIKKLTDTSLSLKLLMKLDDVNAGQVYNYTYKRT